MVIHHRPIHINWRAYVTRRVLIISAISLLGFAAEQTLHLYLAGKVGDYLFAAVIGHLMLEVEG